MDDKDALKNTETDPEEKKALDELKELDELIGKIRTRLVSAEAKPSVADLMRLLERRREVVALKPGPVEARWIDEWQTPQSEE